VIKVKLIKQEYVNTSLPKGWKPYYIFLIVVDDIEVGKIVLREGTRKERYYDGHIGYNIELKYRGHHYAYQATKLLIKEAVLLGFDELIITCSPDNLASKKTILKLKAEYLETVSIPIALRKDFATDELEKEVYLIKLRR
jgi:tagatose 1,6-diphosphate aldolase